MLQLVMVLRLQTLIKSHNNLLVVNQAGLVRTLFGYYLVD
jgi:hypothetical protein